MAMASNNCKLCIAPLNVESKKIKPKDAHYQAITDISINPSYEVVASVSLDGHLLFTSCQVKDTDVDLKKINDINFCRPIRSCDYLNSV